MGQVRRSWEYFRRERFLTGGSAVVAAASQGGGAYVIPSSIQPKENEIWIADTTNTRVVVLDLNGNFKREFYVDSPMDLFVYNDLVYISNNYGPRRISVYDLNGNLVREWSVDDQNNDINGIFVYHDKVYVARYYGTYDEGKILIYDLSGNYINGFNANYAWDVWVYNDRIYYTYEGSSIGISELDGTPVNSYNLYLDYGLSLSADSLCVYNNNIYITCGNDNALVMIDINGNLIGTYSADVGNAGICPYANEIYVINRYDGIYVYDLNFTLLRTLPNYSGYGIYVY